MQRLLVPLSLLVAVGVATTCTQDSDCPDSFCLDATCYAGDPTTFRSTPTAGYTCRTARDCVSGFTCCNRLCRAPGDPALPNPFLDQEVRPDPPDCASLSDFPLSAGCRHTLLWCTPPYWIELDGMTGCTPQHCTSNTDCSDGYTCIITPVVPEGLCWHTGLGAAALKASQCDYAPRDGGSPKHDPAKDPPPPRDDGHRTTTKAPVSWDATWRLPIRPWLPCGSFWRSSRSSWCSRVSSVRRTLRDDTGTHAMATVPNGRRQFNCLRGQCRHLRVPAPTSRRASGPPSGVE